MNNITTRQNEDKQLKRLAAQRELYDAAKVFQGWQIALNVLIPIALSLVSMAYDVITVYAALFGIIIAILDPLLINTTISSLREKAATVQEIFDCDVLQMPISTLKMSNDYLIEDVEKYSSIHFRKLENRQALVNWYPIAINVLPIHIARLVCQRTNCYWDSKLRRRYSSFVRLFGILVFISLIVASVFIKQDITDLVLLMSTLVPFIQYCTKEFFDQKNAAERLDMLVKFANSIWNNELDKPEETINELSRRLQDEIFDHRKTSPLILTTLYNRFKRGDENLMNLTAASLIADVHSRNIC